MALMHSGNTSGYQLKVRVSEETSADGKGDYRSNPAWKSQRPLDGIELDESINRF
jgi:hypothetical protein